MRLSSVSNYWLVNNWMKEVGQNSPDKLSLPTPLRSKLIHEEFHELEEAVTTGDHLAIAKEAADLLVVVYGLFVEMGVSGDEVFAAVMANNQGKVAHRTVRDDGKIIVPPEVKARLKKEMEVALKEILA